MADKQHLYLVDGSAYIFRAYHRLPPLTNPAGTPVGAVYGYTTMLWKLAEDLNKADGPTHLAVILDKGSTSFRNALYDQYKANRPPPPEDLVPQFPLIRDATRAFSLPCIEEDDLEADDLIASYAREATRRGWDVTIVSSDKDLMQLVGKCASQEDGSGGGCIDMLDTMKNQRIDVPEVIEKFGVPPSLVGDVLALMGDSVDNVPGIDKCGPKTAAKWLAQYDSLDGVMANAGEVKGKIGDNLRAALDRLPLNRDLVTIKTDVPLDQGPRELKLRGRDVDALRELYTRYGFTAALRELEGGKPDPATRPAQASLAAAAQASAEAEAAPDPALDELLQPDVLSLMAAGEL